MNMRLVTCKYCHQVSINFILLPVKLMKNSIYLIMYTQIYITYNSIRLWVVRACFCGCS